MSKHKLIRITTVPISLEKLLEGQLAFMNQYFDVTAISADVDGLKKVGERQQVAVFPVAMTRQITPLQDLKAVYKLYRYLKKEKPTIVHTHTPKAGIVGMLAARLAGVPIRLHTVAGLPLMEAQGVKRTILNMVEKATYRFATKVYPNSKGLYDFIVAQQFAPINKLKIIEKGSSNGIDTNYFDPFLYSEIFKIEKRTSLQIPEDAFLFVFVGRLVSDKGINELVAAFCKLYNSHQLSGIQNKKPYLILVGPLETELDPLLPETLQKISENKNIISTGYQQDVRPYLAMSDILTFPSYREGFPNVVMQAGAMGLPAIVSDINGCNEIIKENINGCIIPVKDEHALFTAMNTLYEDEAKTNRLSLASREVITSNYEREEIWNALLAEYHALIDALEN